MKKLFGLNLIVFIFFFSSLVCKAQDYFLDSDFNVNTMQNSEQDFGELENKIQENYDALQKRLDEIEKQKHQNSQTPAVEENKPQAKIKEEAKEKKEGFFKKLFKKKEKTQNEPQNGYYGELPDISKDFEYKKKSNTINPKSDYKIPTVEELDSEINKEKLKQAPLNDALFIDNILKTQDTTSEYLKDLQKTKYALGNLKKCIEEQGSIQRFNACVNMIDLQTKNFEQKYKNTSYSLKESYKDILNTNYHAKVLGNLLYDSNYYARYIPTGQGKYSQSNIDSEKQKLLIKLNKTIFLINSEN